MKALRYPTAISIENFDGPNFELVADILYWMTQRYDPNSSIHDCIDSESDRVQFIKGVVTVFFEKGNIRLNAKKLYAADENVVEELLKITKVLLDAVNAEEATRTGGVSATKKELEPITVSVEDSKMLRLLTTQLTESGARLHSLLANEVECKERRSNVSAFIQAVNSNDEKSSELDTIEDRLRILLRGVKDEFAALEEEVAHMGADRNDILADIQRKREDLDRNKRRLESLQSTRPAFMDEFETLEIELQKHYELYMERYRNVHYLKYELKGIERVEDENAMDNKRNMKRLEAKLQQELKLLGKEERDLPENENGPQDPLEQSIESDGSDNIILDDHSSSAGGSRALLISHSSEDNTYGGSNTSSMSKASISVDSATYFMGGSDIKSGISPMSRASTSEGSDENF